jgi:hypothetical protein
MLIVALETKRCHVNCRTRNEEAVGQTRLISQCTKENELFCENSSNTQNELFYRMEGVSV